jgi:hypothetical protein
MSTKLRFLLTFFVLIMLISLGVAGSVEAQSNNLWQIEMYNNPFLSGSPFATLTTYYVAYNWGDAPPVPGMPQTNWSARFTTSAYFNTGAYRFTVTADDGFTLRVNGGVIFTSIDAPQPGRTFTFDVPMNAGQSFIQIDYRQNTANAYLFVNWGGSGAPIRPTATPRPPRPTPIARLVTQYGDYTNCVRRKLHQVNCFAPDGSWNGPDAGSIRSEPQIVIWYPCRPGAVIQQPLTFGGVLQSTKCSKTGAGYFVGP